ncbi:MAG: transcription elongation factor GreA [Clostridia bacterium]|nr:transcription elongation factor GreA [Clostridia bacterium]MBQ4628203.1 transcription elongation factor GreA [Clostridia bacterium]
MADIILTEEGVLKLEEELRYLKTTKRPEIAEKIKVARDFGDLSENSEYDAAQNELAIMEARIKDIEETLKNVVVLDQSQLSKDIVSIGSKVTIRDMEYPDDEPEWFIIVGMTESNPSENKISDQSPVGKALLGKKKGEIVLVEAPGGEFEYEILNIEFGEV